MVQMNFVDREIVGMDMGSCRDVAGSEADDLAVFHDCLTLENGSQRNLMTLGNGAAGLSRPTGFTNGRQAYPRNADIVRRIQTNKR
jgi:hypothetical protein